MCLRVSCQLHLQYKPCAIWQVAMRICVAQDMPSTVNQLQAELQRARGERDALETRLKLLLQRRAAAGDISATSAASSAPARLRSTAGAPGEHGWMSILVLSLCMACRLHVTLTISRQGRSCHDGHTHVKAVISCKMVHKACCFALP